MSLHTPSVGPSESSVPAILCFHGAGSNAVIFKLQCRRLIANLKSEFRFVFIEAPIESPAGPGILPIFEDCEPFARWVSLKWDPAVEIERPPMAEIHAIDEVINKAVEENGGSGSFVGCIGFSQGARIVAGLLLREQLARRAGNPCGVWNFKFGVILSAPYPPVYLPLSQDEEAKVEDFKLLREIPTVNAWGVDDRYMEARKMTEVCEGNSGYHMVYNGGHHLPMTDTEANDLCNLIRKAWESVQEDHPSAFNKT